MRSLMLAKGKPFVSQSSMSFEPSFSTPSMNMFPGMQVKALEVWSGELDRLREHVSIEDLRPMHSLGFHFHAFFAQVRS